MMERPNISPRQTIRRWKLWNKGNWAQRLGQSLAELKPPLGEVLSDFFLHGLRYEEIAKKRGMAAGSVGVYLKRGLEAMRRIWGREESN